MNCFPLHKLFSKQSHEDEIDDLRCLVSDCSSLYQHKGQDHMLFAFLFLHDLSNLLIDSMFALLHVIDMLENFKPLPVYFKTTSCG